MTSGTDIIIHEKFAFVLYKIKLQKSIMEKIKIIYNLITSRYNHCFHFDSLYNDGYVYYLFLHNEKHTSLCLAFLHYIRGLSCNEILFKALIYSLVLSSLWLHLVRIGP